MIRRLKPEDFAAIWKLGAPYIDNRLRPDVVRARRSYLQVLSMAGNLAMGEFEEGHLIGAVMASSCTSAFAEKGYGNMELWLGSVDLLDQAIAWWEGRPGLRFLSLQFPREVRRGMYRLLRMRGFERKGDMNIRWR